MRLSWASAARASPTWSFLFLTSEQLPSLALNNPHFNTETISEALLDGGTHLVSGKSFLKIITFIPSFASEIVYSSVSDQHGTSDEYTACVQSIFSRLASLNPPRYPGELTEKALTTVLDCLEPLTKFPIPLSRPLLPKYLSDLGILHSECSIYLQGENGCTSKECKSELVTPRSELTPPLLLKRPTRTNPSLQSVNLKRAQPTNSGTDTACSRTVQLLRSSILLSHM